MKKTEYTQMKNEKRYQIRSSFHGKGAVFFQIPSLTQKNSKRIRRLLCIYKQGFHLSSSLEQVYFILNAVAVFIFLSASAWTKCISPYIRLLTSGLFFYLSALIFLRINGLSLNDFFTF